MSYAANAYAKTSRSVLTAREAESAELTKASQRLQMVRDDWANQSGELVAALNFNQKVWTILATSATDPANELPADVKQGVANLAVIVFRQMIETHGRSGAGEADADHHDQPEPRRRPRRAVRRPQDASAARPCPPAGLRSCSS